MELILSSITTACVNLLVFSFIPFLWWFFRHRKEISFFKWLGFIRPHLKSKWWTLLLFAVVYYFFYTFDFTQWISPETMEYLENSGSVSVNALPVSARPPFCLHLLKTLSATAWRRKSCTEDFSANDSAISLGA